MEETAEIACPWCAQTCTVAIDTSQRFQRLVTDCEVCCRPMEVVAECEPGEILSLDVLSG